MGYKVDIDALYDLYSAVNIQTTAWNEQLKEIKEKVEGLMYSSSMTGVAADNIKKYFEYVHVPLIALLSQLSSLHQYNCLLYVDDYNTNIDTGLHAVIKSKELRDYKDRIDSTKTTAVDIDSNIAYVLTGIKDIFSVYYADIATVDFVHTDVSKYLTMLDEAINMLENNHDDSDFTNTSRLIDTIKAFIKEQLSCSRNYKTNFTIETLATSDSFKRLADVAAEIEKEIDEKASSIENAIGNVEDRVVALEEEKESREWIKWVAVGVAIVGSVVLIAVTAGGATPLVCAGVGAAVGVSTAAANSFADNYIENGSLTDDMDWSDFTKNCLIGGVTGAITGYMGASSMGSVIKQPIQKGLYSMGESFVTAGAEGIIDTTWEFGEAVISGKPGDEILSILEENTDEMLKDMFVEGTTGFVSGYVGGKFDVDSSSKGFLKTLKEESVKNFATSFTKNGTDVIWDVGDAVIDPNSSSDVTTILKKEGKEFLSNFANDFVSGEVEAVIGGGNKEFRKHKGYDDENPGLINSVIADTVSDAVGDFVGSLSKQGTETLLGDRERIDIQEIWEEDMDGGRNIVKTASKSATKHISNHKFSDDSLKNTIKKSGSYNDKNGTVDVVVFDKYAVTKEDYEAACEVAGKGAYKDKSVQDILGLPKKTNVSRKNLTFKKVSINNLKESEYNSRKTTNSTKLDFIRNPIINPTKSSKK